MLKSLRQETEGKLQMRLSPRKKSLTSLFKRVRIVKELGRVTDPVSPYPRMFYLSGEDSPHKFKGRQ